MIALVFLLVSFARVDVRAAAARLAVVPRLVALALFLLLPTATIAIAAEKSPTTGAPGAPPPSTTVETLVVPDVRGQVFVFAKGMLEDEGFAWRVRGGVRGFAANRVASQSPAPGARVVNNGAPTVLLELAGTREYDLQGTPQDRSPYRGTPAAHPSPGRDAPGHPGSRR